MATKKQTKTRRKRKGLHSGGTGRRRKSSRRRSTGLSAMMNPTALMNAGKQALASGAGGLGAVIVNKVILPPTANKLTRVAVGVGGAIVGALLLNMPTVAGGFTGGMVALAFKDGVMNEGDTQFAQPDVLDPNTPLYLDEDTGAPMVLEEGENGAQYRYLSAEEIQTLEEQGAFTDYVPM